MSHYSHSSAHIHARIRALLAEGLDPSKIVERLGVTESMISAVLHGKARPRPQKRREPEPDQHGLVVPDPMSEPGKCPTCHSMVRLPCYSCQVVAWKEREAKRVRLWLRNEKRRDGSNESPI